MTTFSSKLSPLLILLLVAAVTFTSCDDDSNPDPVDITIDQTVDAESDLSELSQALKDTELDSTLATEGPFTLFAPVDSVLPDDLSGEEIQALVSYHIVDDQLTYEDLQNMDSVVALNGETLSISVDSETDVVTINGEITIDESESIEASNGIIYVLTNDHLTPPEEN